MNNSTIIAIGSYTQKLPHAPGGCGEGIVIAELNEETGQLSKQYTISGMTNPSYIDWDSENKFLYAMTESSEGKGEVQSFAADADDHFVLKSFQTGPGRAGCHLKANERGDKIFAASYMDGCLKGYSIINGEIGTHFFNYSYKGDGPNRERQSSPHAHQVLISPDKSHLYVCDLGSDRIWKHQLESKDLICETALELPPGYGPRHLAFDRDGKFLFILCELKPRLIVAAISDKDGSLTIAQDLPTVDDSLADISAPAAVKVHPSGHSVVISNRFSDRLSVFKIIRESNSEHINLEYLSDFSSKGKTPRDLTFSPSGRWLLIANQDSDDVQVRAFNRETGYPEEYWAPELKTGTPVCLICLI